MLFWGSFDLVLDFFFVWIYCFWFCLYMKAVCFHFFKFCSKKRQNFLLCLVFPVHSYLYCKTIGINNERKNRYKKLQNRFNGRFFHQFVLQNDLKDYHNILAKFKKIKYIFSAFYNVNNLQNASRCWVGILANAGNQRLSGWHEGKIWGVLCSDIRWDN